MANPASANCLDETGTYFAGEVVGEGTATCAESMECFDKALGAPDVKQAVTSCVVQAAPEVKQSPEWLVRCETYRQACQAL